MLMHANVIIESRQVAYFVFPVCRPNTDLEQKMSSSFDEASNRNGFRGDLQAESMRRNGTNGSSRTSSPMSEVNGKRFDVHSSARNHHVNNTFHKLNGTAYGNRPNSNKHSQQNASPIIQHPMSQSLRCKSSYSMQLSPLMVNNAGHGTSTAKNGLNSPTMLMHQQTRRATAKRLSTLGQHFQFYKQPPSQPARPQSQTVFCSDNLLSADSEFSFIPSQSINLDLMRRHQHHQTVSTPPHSNFRYGTTTGNGHQASSRSQQHNMNSISSSASLMLNGVHSRRKGLFDDKSMLGKQTVTPTPPPVPPHRTHLHHF